MPSRAKQPVEPALPRGIGRPATNALAEIGVTRLEQVARFTEEELLALHGVGPKAVGVLKAALLDKGQSLAKPEQAKPPNSNQLSRLKARGSP